MKLIVVTNNKSKDFGEFTNYEVINGKHHFDFDEGFFAEIEYPNEIVDFVDESNEFDTLTLYIDWDKPNDDEQDEEDDYDYDDDDLEMGFNPYMGCYDYDC